MAGSVPYLLCTTKVMHLFGIMPAVFRTKDHSPIW